MDKVDERGRASLAVVLAGLGTAAVFEALTVFATQDKTVRAASPWQDDPYDAVVSLAQFAVPMLGLVIALRLLVWRAPGGSDRAQQTLRAVGVMTALVGLTLGFEWAALIGRVHAPNWDRWTSVLVGGLAIATLAAAVTAVLLARRRAPGGSSGRWRHDWLGDVVRLGQRAPGLRRWITPAAADGIRRHAMALFVALSGLAALAVIGLLAVGEGWTDPLLIGWAFVVETTSNLAFCLISNRIAGFIARAPRSRLRRRAEASLLAGCVAIQIATAFRDSLWPIFGSGSLTSVPALAALTLGTGLLVAAITATLPYARSG